eukprot:CAMPEP_0172316842 /NCGR_PEP_ID=MMETSP1058-20130122/29707_1 /TAXON_ID=83371 /ORGANISM="Detonula confervacea, Strain CCMP 353" /LENGTH=57 /DNA_ID=CAMNT_0013031265 /DNA_START=34 /DNA_END=202 /DNA_ORIENTATION=+
MGAKWAPPRASAKTRQQTYRSFNAAASVAVPPPTAANFVARQAAAIKMLADPAARET